MSAFVSKNMIFPYIHLYRFIFPQEIRAPFGHQNIKKYCSFKCPDKKNFSIFNGFQGLMILNKLNSNTIFYSVAGLENPNRCGTTKNILMIPPAGETRLILFFILPKDRFFSVL